MTLSSEQAVAELKQYRDAAWTKSRDARVKKLPAKDREHLEPMLLDYRITEDGEHDRSADADLTQEKRQAEHLRRREASLALAVQLQKAKPADRMRMFEALFPTMAPAVERAFMTIDQRTYHAGYGEASMPFRAAGRSARDATAARDFLEQVLRGVAGYSQDLTWFAAWAPYLNWHTQHAIGPVLAAAIDLGGKEGDAIRETLFDCAAGRHAVGSMGSHVLHGLLMCGRRDCHEFVGKLLLAAQRQEGLRSAILGAAGDAHPDAFRYLLGVIIDNDLARFSAVTQMLNGWAGLAWDSISQKVVRETLDALVTVIDKPAEREKMLKKGTPRDAWFAIWGAAFHDATDAVKLADGLLGDKDVERRYVGAQMLEHIELLDLTLPSLLRALDDRDLRIVQVAMRGLQRESWRYNQQHNTTPYYRYDDGGPPCRLPDDMFERVEQLLERFPAKPEPAKELVWPWTATTIDRDAPISMMIQLLGPRDPAVLIRHLASMNPWQRTNVARQLAAKKEKTPQVRAALISLLGDPSGDAQTAAAEAIGDKDFFMTGDEAAVVEQLLSRKADKLRTAVMKLLLGQSDAAALASAERLLAAGKSLLQSSGLELLRSLVEAGREADKAQELARAWLAKAKKPGKEQTALVDAVLAAKSAVHTDLGEGLGLYTPEQLSQPLEPTTQQVTPVTPAALALLTALDDLVHEHRDVEITIPTWQHYRYAGADEFDGYEGDDGGGFDYEMMDDDAIDQVAGTAAASEGEDDDVARSGPMQTTTVGNAGWSFTQPNPARPVAEQRSRLPLADVWIDWFETRDKKLRDADGLELERASMLLGIQRPTGFTSEVQAIADGLAGPERKPLRYQNVVNALVTWLKGFAPVPPATFAQFALSAAEEGLHRGRTAAGASTAADRKLMLGHWSDENAAPDAWRLYNSAFTAWLDRALWHRRETPDAWTKPMRERLWRLQRYRDQPTPTAARNRCSIRIACEAHEDGLATEADLLDLLIGVRDSRRWGHTFNELSALTAMRRPKLFNRFPVLEPLVQRVRDRILEVELPRGEMPTPASFMALSLRHSGGASLLLELLGAARALKLSRGGYSWDRKGTHAEVWSHLIRVSMPADGETPAAVAKQMKAREIDRGDLIAVAMYAPQWAAHVEAALGATGLEDAVWWIHAHTRDSNWRVEQDVLRRWRSAISERTPLKARDLVEGAVDVAWFHRVRQTVDQETWDALHTVARYASSGGGHKRAQLYADAMLDKVAVAELLEKVTKKRNLDSVRALGLVPIGGGAAPKKKAPTKKAAGSKKKASKKQADGAAGADGDSVLARWQTLKTFLRESRQFGSQRQASEKRAVEIGLENLARTAGYADPIRMEWAMEAEVVSDLAKGPVSAESGDVKLTLSITASGAPELTVLNTKTGKELKSVPPKVKKDEAIAALRGRVTELKRQASRSRQSLEQMMCRGTTFSGAELQSLCNHPVLAPMLARVVMILEDGKAGYPVKGGKALEDHAGKLEPVRATEPLRIAHPHDLLAGKQWHLWQRDCFARERLQPFKQVFRELYVLTPAEKKTGDHSARYAGHQVNPRQAFALLARRGWVVSTDSGVTRTDHVERIVASIEFQDDVGTAAGVEGLTMEHVSFRRIGQFIPLKLDAVPPRLFSEVMRDVDLIVSVAHRGGVDPEASASTVEMRAALLKETVALLGLKNVTVKEAHAVIKGKLADYTVHLGSAIVHRQPGGAVFIVPVHAAHRGRLFLPFADDDPKTAELLSKVLLLARDDEIQDPAILDQIRR